MTNLLTTRQVQDLLKVDRITVYRMLNDGRLKGVKIGQQWRFPSSEVERLLSGAPGPTADTPVRAFPTHCVQTIQSLFSAIGQVGALVIDNQGKPLTEPSTPCSFCALVQSTPQGRTACGQSWQQFSVAGEGEMLTCHAGLQYSRAPILDNSERIGWFLAGPFQPAPGADPVTLAADNDIRLAELREAAAELPASANKAHMRAWPQQASAAIQAILNERSGLMQRLKNIAEISQLES
ncbi:protein containg DNA binding domain, excisionase family [Longilinea arvoryzae]|uniref:Protein containg DNA binding domain, excisionase family n=1 Tax=Longilinea arvoryzae TaxID=360412 RepID=A0A0S7BFH6_9CHLR|nr:PocR ligand-binding domain-containing protein [Longilinea arvoryzae]GAP13331.1 protein containg DNA binding domain, excisionase family [Longilinea arvoryzae]